MPLREPYVVRSVDLQKLLACTGSTLTELYKKLNIQYADNNGNARKGSVKHIRGPEVRRILEARGYAFPTKSKVISFMMCKGGVGKTTTAFFLAQRLSAYGARVLAVDADSQGNLTSAFDPERYNFSIDAETPILLDVIAGECSAKDAIVEVTSSMHLLPSTPLNANLEGRIRENFKNPSLPVQKVIAALASKYDYILIDCAPALNLTNTAIICASDLVVLPVTPDKFSQLGLEQTLKEISQIELDFNLSANKRILFTRYDGREFTSLKYLAEIAKTYQKQIFPTPIRTCTDVKNVVTRKDDLFLLKKSHAKEDYDILAQELMGLTSAFEGRRVRTSTAA
jgi:chromosome partitioning protein